MLDRNLALNVPTAPVMGPATLDACPPRTKVDLVYFNAGGGHRMSALALEAAIREQQRPWQVRRVNLTEILDAKDVFRRVTGVSPGHWRRRP